MNRIFLLSMLGLLLPLFGTAAPTGAASSCSLQGARALQALNPDQIVGLIRGISQLPPSQIKGLQSCLKLRGCYAQDRKDIDGVVGPYTTAALYRSAYRVCNTAPPPATDCGNGREVVSYELTKADIAALEAPPPQPEPSNPEENPSPASSDAVNATIEPPPAPGFSDDLKNGLAALEGADYPSRELFENALTYTTEQPVTDAKRLDLLKKELRERKQDLVQQACKAHPINSSGPGWVPNWRANMVYSLPNPVYGMFPFWLADEPTTKSDKQPAKQASHQVDFGLLERIGWFGITFSRQGVLNPQPLEQTHTKIEHQIELARRFRTDVDLVVYKRLSPDEWIELAYENPDPFVQTLSKNIANTVGARLGGFLNTVQHWTMPKLLTSPSTAWDGVTLQLEGYPYNDPGAMRFLSRLLHQLRLELNAREPAGSARHMLHLNLVVPYDVLVPQVSSGQAQLVQTSASGTSGLNALINFVPKHRDDSTVTGPGETQESIIDNFLVFLPEPTSTTKKDLRLAVEEAFARTADRKRLLSDSPDISLAAWRFQMLRRIVYIISPSAWNYPQDYKRPGGQVFDDMLYAHDNFGAVGFWPLPAYDGNNQELTSEIRQIFQHQGGDAPQRSLAPLFQSSTICIVANFFAGWRRELFLSVEIVFFLVLAYCIAAYWKFELRDFYHAHQWWFRGVVFVGLLVLVLICLFDRNLRNRAQFVVTVVIFALVVAFFFRQSFLSSVERNLP